MAGVGLIIVVVAMFVIFYFVILRPQKKRQNEHRALLDELETGEKIITIGGIYGEIDSIGEHDVVIKVEDGTRIKMLKNSVMAKQQMEQEPTAGNE